MTPANAGPFGTKRARFAKAGACPLSNTRVTPIA